MKWSSAFLLLPVILTELLELPSSWGNYESPVEVQRQIEIGLDWVESVVVLLEGV